MKSVLHISFLFLIVTQSHYPQWTNQNPVPDGNDLWSTFFIDDTGWIVGEDGFIKKTTNAGLDWLQQTSGTTITLRSVQFIDQNTGWICGDGGLILKTSNGGQNWTVLTSGSYEKLVDIQFYDLYIGWVVGDGGTILKTTNSGISWTIQTSSTTANLNSVDFVDAFVGYTVGDTIILKTTDGGLNWIDKSIHDPHILVNTVEFIDANTGYIGVSEVGVGRIKKTTDGGETWVASYNMKIEGDEKSGITSIFFKDLNNGFAVGGGQSKSITITTDGGSTWITKASGDGIYSGSLMSVYVNSTGKGWAVGSSGQIFITEDDGNTWAHILSGSGYPNDAIYSVFFINENIGWAAGQRSLDSYAEIILKTTNGGKIWKTQYLLLGGAASHPLNCVYFIDANNGWAVGSVGKILRTTNGGTDWTQQTSGTTSKLYGVSFTDVNNGTAVGSSGKILRTANGGTNWRQQTSGTTNGLLGVSFIDVNNGTAVGSGGIILRTTNGGTNWSEQTSGTTANLNGIKFINSNLGMCVGNEGTVLLSSDGGENWVAKSSGITNDLKAVAFSNSTTVWISGSNGKILRTTDLGDNWAYFDGTTTNDLNAINFVNENIGWVGGMNGTIFKYFDCPSPITVTKPNGGEIWKSGTTKNITWSGCGVESVNIYYSTNNGANWISIATNEPASTGSYSWTVPSLKSLFCKIKIEDALNSLISDESDGIFNIWKICTVVQTPLLGQQIIDFGEANTNLSLFVNNIDQITTSYFEYESPASGTLPSGIVVISEYYWEVTSVGISFTDGIISVPISALRGVVDASKLVWLKRTNSGDPWGNIGGIVSGDNLECTISFNSFSEFAIGSTDPINPLPVELHSFEASVNGFMVNLKWQTATEVNNYGFEVERCLDNTWEKIGFIQGNGNSTSPKSYSYSDNNPFGGSKFQYRLKQIDTDGKYDYSNVIEVEIIPTKFSLYQNYPNPFNPTTKIRYQLSNESNVEIKIYDILGTEVGILLDEEKKPGTYEVELNAQNLSSGTYIYRIIAGEFVETKKMILLK